MLSLVSLRVSRVHANISALIQLPVIVFVGSRICLMWVGVDDKDDDVFC